jgi:hypothetical protein
MLVGMSSEQETTWAQWEWRVKKSGVMTPEVQAGMEM